MKEIFARIGRTYTVDDKTYEEIRNAMEEDDSEKVCSLLEQLPYDDDGDSYLPGGCSDNPNVSDFTL